MKSLLSAVALITLTFLSCSKNDDDNPPTIDTTIFEGTWSGTYSGDNNGMFSMNVTDIGTFTGSFVHSSGAVNVFSGTLEESGQFTMTFTVGGTGTGNFNADTDVVTGTWETTNGTQSGSLEGTKN